MLHPIKVTAVLLTVPAACCSAHFVCSLFSLTDTWRRWQNRVVADRAIMVAWHPGIQIERAAVDIIL